MSRQGQPLRFCDYCGTPIGSHLIACAAHADLPALDPHYQMRHDLPMRGVAK